MKAEGLDPRTEPSAVKAEGRPTDTLVPVGVIVRPHGVRGEVRVFPYNPSSTLLLDADEVFLIHKGGVQKTKVRSARSGPKGLFLLKLEGVNERDAAEALRDFELRVPRASFAKPAEDEWYHVDMIGGEVKSPEGQLLGTVVDVIRYPSVDCFVIDTGRGRVEVPATPPYLIALDAEVPEIVVSELDSLLPAGSRDVKKS
ncbi:MAG: ribosome maturation factor RimM [Myxococcota bacterium]